LHRQQSDKQFWTLQLMQSVAALLVLPAQAWAERLVSVYLWRIQHRLFPFGLRYNRCITATLLSWETPPHTFTKYQVVDLALVLV
jgi:hypothetical protein